MADDRRERVEALFDAVAALPPEERSCYLDEHCADAGVRAEVESLLRFDSGDEDFLRSPVRREAYGDPAADGTVAGASSSPDLLQLQRLGPYTVVRLIGEGGMGAVYEARQENPNRAVALKVIRPGLTTHTLISRFKREADLLGKLQHPGIAHIYEAGTARATTAAGAEFDQPYFAMELIRGVPLVAYVNAQHLATRARLELVARVADAMQHAHERGVIHRDLKPGNVLVDAAGQPKILDFGVARATDADVQAATVQTETGQLVGTLAYMSPEQVAGDSRAVDVRTDIYALGVLLYEVLSGSLPYEVVQHSIIETARIIREVEPRRLSSLHAGLRGDVETIVLKALEKDPARRYATAADLAADIRRFLGDEPITARPASAVYQLRKFARRNRALVGGLVAVFIVLVAGVVVATSFAMRESRQRARAEALLAETRAAKLVAEQARDKASVEAEKSKAAVRFIQDVLASADPDAGEGETLTVVDALDRAANRLEELADKPAVAAAVEHVLGESYRSLGRDDEAFKYLRQALATRRKLYGDAHPDVPLTLNSLAAVQLERGEYAEAEKLSRESLAIGEKYFPGDELALAAAKSGIAYALDGAGRHEEAVALEREVLATRERLLPPGDELIPKSMTLLGFTLVNLGHFDEANALYTAALEQFRAHHGDANSFVISTLHNQASLQANLGHADEAQRLAGEALTLAVDLLGADHPITATLHYQLADLAIGQGDFAAALEHATATLASRQEAYGEEHALTAQAEILQAFLLQKQGRVAEAEPLARQAFTTWRKVNGEGDRQTAYAQFRLADILADEEKFAEAEPVALAALEKHRALYADDKPPVQAVHRLLARIYTGLGKPDEAAKWSVAE
ncbi:MAG TPA: serine/threonine-protein kinase [Phycisphaerae bacterium]|nr:serine/threonine-protein kinase [Phycisphaerae bacterium]